MKYFDEIKRTMEWIATNERTMFLGQSVGVAGTFMFNTLKDVPIEKRLELPVCESFQMQLTFGLALSGYVPISIYPRQNFMMLAVGDLSNIVDKYPEISGSQEIPKIIVRVAVGPDSPVHPGHQHVGDFTKAFEIMFKNIEVVKLENPEDIFPAYKRALDPEVRRSFIMVEVGNYYQQK